MKLRPLKNSSYKILNRSEWDDFDKKLWDEFDDISSNHFQGTAPHNNIVAISKEGNQRIAFTEIIYDCGFSDKNLDRELGGGSKPSRKFYVRTCAYICGEEEGGKMEMGIFDLVFHDEKFFEKDKDHDLLSDPFPDNFYYCVDELIESMWGDFGVDTLLKFIKDEIGGVENIKDELVKDFVVNYLREEKTLATFVIVEDPLCGYEQYEVRLEKKEEKFIYWDVSVNYKDDQDFRRIELAVTNHELQPDELRKILDESSWLSFDCVLDGLDGEYTSESLLGSTIKLESDIIKEKWLAEWMDSYLENKNNK